MSDSFGTPGGLEDDDDIPEQDFSTGEQGKNYHRYWASRGLVEIAPELRELFPTGEAVNDALRLLIALKRQVGA